MIFIISEPMRLSSSGRDSMFIVLVLIDSSRFVISCSEIAIGERGGAAVCAVAGGGAGGSRGSIDATSTLRSFEIIL